MLNPTGVGFPYCRKVLGMSSASRIQARAENRPQERSRELQWPLLRADEKKGSH